MSGNSNVVGGLRQFYVEVYKEFWFFLFIGWILILEYWLEFVYGVLNFYVFFFLFLFLGSLG